MGLLAVAFSIAVYIGARVLQGAATAMVMVAGFSIVTDSVPNSQLGYMLGYIDVGLTLGFSFGPLVGGIVFDAAGYYAVCVIAIGQVIIDLILRFAVIEKRTAAFWLTMEVDSSPGPVTSSSASQYGSIQPSGEHKYEDEDKCERGGAFVFGKLLQQPQLLITTWSFILQSSCNAALDTVCFQSFYLFDYVLLTDLDRSFLSL